MFKTRGLSIFKQLVCRIASVFQTINVVIIMMPRIKWEERDKTATYTLSEICLGKERTTFGSIAIPSRPAVAPE